MAVSVPWSPELLLVSLSWKLCTQSTSRPFLAASWCSLHVRTPTFEHHSAMLTFNLHTGHTNASHNACNTGQVVRIGKRHMTAGA